MDKQGSPRALWPRVLILALPSAEIASVSWGQEIRPPQSCCCQDVHTPALRRRMLHSLPTLQYLTLHYLEYLRSYTYTYGIGHYARSWERLVYAYTNVMPSCTWTSYMQAFSLHHKVQVGRALKLPCHADLYSLGIHQSYHMNLCVMPGSWVHSKPQFRKIYPVAPFINRNQTVSSQRQYSCRC